MYFVRCKGFVLNAISLGKRQTRKPLHIRVSIKEINVILKIHALHEACDPSVKHRNA